MAACSPDGQRASRLVAEVERGRATLVCDVYGGPGPTAVALHGLAGYAGEWTPTARWLSRTRRVVVPDQRGHGRSTRHPGDLSRDAYVADLVGVIEGLDLGPVVLVGQSLGGHTAMLAAARRPDLVAALVVVEATPDRDAGARDRVARWLSSWPVPFASEAAAADFFRAAGHCRTLSAARVWAAGLEERDGGWWPRFVPEAMVASLREVAASEHWDEWEAVACPTLVVRGEHGAVSGEQASRMLSRNRFASLAEIPGAGHDVHLDRPDRWRRAVAGFLSGPTGR